MWFTFGVLNLRIVGIDPGYAIVGWGILEYKSSKFVTLDYGAITTDASQKFCDRLEKIYDSLNDVFSIYKPECMAIEKLFFSVNKKTAIDVAQARGVILICAKKFNISVFEYAPVEVKKSVVGYGRATKSQVMNMIKMVLNLKAIPKPDDTADALALAVAHAHCSVSRLFIAKENL